MAKQIKTKIKLQIAGGQASPGSKVGPALGQHGLNIGEFCAKFNEATKEQMGEILPVELIVYTDRSYNMVIKRPPATELIKKYAKLSKGAGNPLKDKAGELTDEQLSEIAKLKMPDLNTTDLQAAKKIIAGSARQMGVKIVN